MEKGIFGASNRKIHGGFVILEYIEMNQDVKVQKNNKEHT